jgi:FKBP-type peptidyl-prolyl cis-trans isomerase FkpA
MNSSMRLAAALSFALLATPAMSAAPAAAAPADAIIALPLQPVVAADKRVCTAKTKSGLGYAMLSPGTGPKPGANDFVLVNYIGYLAANGQAFDQNMTSPFNLNGVIPGFSEGIQMMERGSTYRFCIPSAMGYADKPTGSIPANSDLVFQVELLDSKTTAEVEELRKKQPVQ